VYGAAAAPPVVAARRHGAGVGGEPRVARDPAGRAGRTRNPFLVHFLFFAAHRRPDRGSLRAVDGLDGPGGPPPGRHAGVRRDARPRVFRQAARSTAQTPHHRGARTPPLARPAAPPRVGRSSQVRSPVRHAPAGRRVAGDDRGAGGAAAPSATETVSRSDTRPSCHGWRPTPARSRAVNGFASMASSIWVRRPSGSPSSAWWHRPWARRRTAALPIFLFSVAWRR